MFAFEFSGGLGHGGFVERAGIVERALVFKWREDSTAPDAVAVGLALGLPAGVKIGAHFFCRRQCGLRAGVARSGRAGIRRRERADRVLKNARPGPSGVYAGVRAACAVDEDFLLGDLAGGFGDGALDGRSAGSGFASRGRWRLVVGDREF